MQNRKRDTDVQNRLLDSVGEGEGGMFRENSIETCIASRVKQITSPGWMHETSALAWCTGKTQRDGWRGRWEGGSGWGTHVNPQLIHVNIWQKPLQYCKVISLQLIKINEKKKRKTASKRQCICSKTNSVCVCVHVCACVCVCVCVCVCTYLQRDQRQRTCDLSQCVCCVFVLVMCVHSCRVCVFTFSGIRSRGAVIGSSVYVCVRSCRVCVCVCVCVCVPSAGSEAREQWWVPASKQH